MSGITNYYKTIIIGAGISGLSTAYHLKDDYLVFEKNKEPGGLCRTFNINNFKFDFSGHLIHSVNMKLLEFFRKFSDDLVENYRNSVIRIVNRFVDYPFQYNLIQLPDQIKKKCIDEYCKILKNRENKFENFKDWIIKFYGKGIYKYFMFPYNRKLWDVELESMTTDWFDRFMPQPDIEKITGKVKEKKTGYNSFFYYPENGIGSFINNLFLKIKNNVKLNSKVEYINIKEKYIIVCGNKYKYENLINTIPLPEFLKLSNVNFGSEFNVTSVLNLNLGLETEVKVPYHWIYFPEKPIPFYRMGFYHNFAENMVPEKDYFNSVYIELSYNFQKAINVQQKIDLIKKKMFESGIYSKANTKIIEEQCNNIKYAYVIYDKNRKCLLEKYNEYFNKNNIKSVGRYAEWKYSSMTDSVITSMKIAGELNKK